MRKLFIKLIQKKIDIDSSIIKINIEEPLCFRGISCNFVENIVYSDNDIVLDLSKKAIVIYNPYQINVNESKLLKHLYKKLEKTILEEYPNMLSELEKILFAMLDELINKSNYPIDYQSNIDISKLLSCLNVNYDDIPLDKYVEKLIRYISINKEINNDIDLIISYGLLNLLTQKELYILEEKLCDLDITLIDISFIQKNTEPSLIVDGDWCII